MTVGAQEDDRDVKLDEGYAVPGQLTARTAPRELDVMLSNGRKVRVRGLTRLELIVNGKGTEDADEIERRNVATCMVRPVMTRDQVRQWQRNSPPNELAAVTGAIRDLSGLGEGAPKSDVAEVRD